jgi:hypothetical protein
MDFEPDVIVTEGGSPLIRMVVEAKLCLDDLKHAESALKRYMLGMGAPLGLIVSPTKFVIYRDRFTGFSDDSVELVGAFDVPETYFSRGSGTDPFAFQREVQAWLEEIASSQVIRDLSAEAREALAENVLPALAGTVVRAAGPREARAG